PCLHLFKMAFNKLKLHTRCPPIISGGQAKDPALLKCKSPEVIGTTQTAIIGKYSCVCAPIATGSTTSQRVNIQL
ncbi:hypothetical protein STEG23_027424, partial [Scotinomys teguina]